MHHSFKLAKKKWQNPQVKQSKTIREKEVLFSMNRYEAGDFVLADQFVANTLGHVLSGFDRGDAHDKFEGGAIFQDAATGIIWVEYQLSLGAGETILAKDQFEELIWEIATTEISHLHSDNGIYTTYI